MAKIVEKVAQQAMLNYQDGVIIVCPQYLLQDEATPAEPTYKEMSLSKDMISPMDSLSAGSPGKGLGYFLQFDTPKSSQSRSRSRKRTVEKQKAARKSQSTPRKLPAIEKDIQPVTASKKPGSTSKTRRSGSSSPTRRRSSSLADSLTRFKELQAMRQKLDSPTTDLSDNKDNGKTKSTNFLSFDTAVPSQIEVSGNTKALLGSNEGMTPYSLGQLYNTTSTQLQQTVNDFSPSSHNSICIKTPTESKPETDLPKLTTMDSENQLIAIQTSPSFQHKNHDGENDQLEANPTCDTLYVDHNDNEEDLSLDSSSHQITELTSIPQNKPHIHEETTPNLSSKDCKLNALISDIESSKTNYDRNIQVIENFSADSAKYSTSFSSNETPNGATNPKTVKDDSFCPGSKSDKYSATADRASSHCPSPLSINISAENLVQELNYGGKTMNSCSEVETESDTYTGPDISHHNSSADICCKTTRNSEEIENYTASTLLNNETDPVTDLHNISSDFQLNIRNDLGKDDATFSAPIDHHHDSDHHTSSMELFVDGSDIEAECCNRESQEEGNSELNSEAHLDSEVCEKVLEQFAVHIMTRFELMEYSLYLFRYIQ